MAPCTVDGDDRVRIGLGYVKGVGKSAEDIVAERDRGGPFADPGDLVRRAPVGRDLLAQLVRAGALDRFDANRRRLLWEIRLHRAPERGQLALPLDAAPTPRLAGMSEWDRMVADHETMHLSTGPHPMALLRPSLPESIRMSLDLRTDRHGLRVTVAGMMIARQRPHTAKGIVFMLLEDEHGMTNIIVPPDIYERDRVVVRAEPLVQVTGRLEKREGTINVIAERVEALARPGRPVIGPARTEVDDELRELRAAAPVANSFGRGRR
jgi:error-prone DNA polymerase